MNVNEMICSFLQWMFSSLAGNGLGDPCDGDFDADKIPDEEDACSVNHHVTHTDFTWLQKISLIVPEETSPYQPAIWQVDSEVRPTIPKTPTFHVNLDESTILLIIKTWIPAI